MKLAICLNCLLLTSALFGQTTNPTVPVVRAQGQATVTAKPDQVTVDIGVVTQAPTAQAAASQNAKQVTAVLAELKKLLGSDAELKTVNYSLHPNYKYAKDGANPSIVGYNASNTVQVRSSDLAVAGKIIDGATGSGANNIQGIHFSLENEQAVRAEALKLAAEQARANVEALSSALGLKIVKIVRVEDSNPVIVQPLHRMEMMQARAADAAPTPVEPGQIQVRATVSVTVEVSQ